MKQGHQSAGATLRYLNPNGDQGYPGTLTTTVTYILDNHDRLHIEYGAKLADGLHRIIVQARDGSGREGFEEIPLNVHNGPGVVISGLRAHSTRRGTVHLSIDAFSAQDPFNPRYAEARSSIPVWVWVMVLFVVAWAVWYAARMWDVPPAFAATPTYAAQPSGTPAEALPAAAAKR